MNWGQSVRFGKRAILLGGAAALLWAVPAAAQEKQRYNLPAGDASTAVQRLAVQSGLQIMAPNNDLSGITTNPVDGSYTPVEALRHMLANKGLTVSVSSEGTVVIRKAGAGDGAQEGASASGEIVVTGSRIERAGFDTLQAASSTDAAEIARRGYTNILEALQDTPGFAPADNSQIGTSQGNLAVAQSFADFFGLGSQRTLTLVNGRRFVSSNTVSGTGGGANPGSQVDLNLIPVGLIERVETVAIGGAPVYGTDAIAGTVNVILKEDYEGLELTGQTSISDRGDAANQSVRALFGRNFMEGRGNIVLGAEYVRQEGMLLNGRFPQLALAASGNTNPTDGIAAQTVIDQRIALITEGGLPFVSGALPTGSNYIMQNGVPLQFASDGRLVPFVLGARYNGDSGGLFRNGGDGLNPADHALLLSPNHRILLNAIGNFDITENINFFAEGSYAKTSGTKLSDLFQFAAPGLGGPSLTFNVNNPYLSQQARDILVANGLTTFRLNRNLNDIADSRPAKTELEVYRIVAGFKGNFNVAGQAWNWDLAYNYGRSRNSSEFNQINQTRFLQAIDVVGTPGSVTCRSGGSCVPLNLFGQGAFTQAAADYVIDQGIGVSVNELEAFTANLGGKLPFGIAEPIAFSIGYEHRREAGSFSGNDIINAGLTLLGGAVAFPDAPEGSFNTDEVYGETIVPLIDDDMGVPLIRSAQFEGAIRYVDHSIAGGDITWSAGGRLEPRLGGVLEGITLRGVYTRAIRSPSILELFLNTTPVARAANDVCAPSRINTGANPAVRRANCIAALQAVGVTNVDTFAPTTNGASPFGTVGGNRDLDNEKANSWSLGVVYQPPAIPGLRFSMDYSSVKLRGAISRFTLLTAQSACYDSPNFPNEGACDAFDRLTAAQAAAQSTATGRQRIAGDIADNYLESYFNTAVTDFAGILGELQYTMEVPNISSLSGEVGQLRFGIKAFHVAKYTSQNSGASPVIDAAGTIGTPAWRLNGRIGYAFDPFDLDVQVLWTDKVKADNTLTIEDIPILNIPAYTMVNTSLGFRVADNFRLQFSVRNLFDKKVPYPAIVLRQFGAYDPIGRTFQARASVNF
jgi:iron complex outermembrane receptor protein